MKEIIEKYSNGQRKYNKASTGRETWYNEAGQILRIKYPNGNDGIRRYNADGICIYFKNVDGDICKYNDFGLPTYKKTKNTEETWEYDETGKKCICHTLKEYFD
jgi:hypothetical protein